MILIDEGEVHCGAPMVFDPKARGTTCGGLEVEGALVCKGCGALQLSEQSRPVEKWKLAKGGRSVEIGTARIRADHRGAEPGMVVEALMARIVQLPELEREVEHLRRLADAELAFRAQLDQMPYLAEEAIPEAERELNRLQQALEIEVDVERAARNGRAVAAMTAGRAARAMKDSVDA